MLELLRIQNLALIEDMELEFASGLNVLTGETGAGKSFILKALNFLLGDKLETNMVRLGAEKATAEALFALEDGDLIVRRELMAESGRSRIYLNNNLASQESIRELRQSLIIHASQHGQQKLLQPAFQAHILDSFMNKPELLQQRDENLRSLREISQKREQMLARFAQLEERRDMLEFQQKEIDKISPQAGEEEELEERRASLRHMEEARQNLDLVQNILFEQDGLLSVLGELETGLNALSRNLPEYENDTQTVQEARNYLNDLAVRLRRQGLGDVDGNDIEKMDARLFELAQLKRRLRKSLPEILEMQQEIRDNLSFLDACGLDLKTLGREEKELAQTLGAILKELNEARRTAAVKLANDLVLVLKDLGFSEHVMVEFEFTPQVLHPGGDDFAPSLEDRARLLWVPNPGQAPQPLDKIASGGELSRFLLAVVSLMAREMSPTLIFDEVDSGVGGLTLNKVSERLAQLAKSHQVLLITHWPQLAARAHQHFQVSKEVEDGATYTRCLRLKNDEIVKELARMAGGGAQGEALAKELVLKPA